MLRSQLLDAFKGEAELDINRLLGPERAVMIEHGHAIGWRYEIRCACLRDAVYKCAGCPGREPGGAAAGDAWASAPIQPRSSGS